MQKVIFLIFLFIFPFEFSNVIEAQTRWENKPYLQWSRNDLRSMFNNSPWVKKGIAGFLQPERHSEGNASPTIRLPSSIARTYEEPIQIFYNLRLLTAQPIREAYYCAISLGEVIELSVDIRDAGEATSIHKRQERLSTFISKNPNSPILKGEEKYIIIALMLYPNHPSQDINVSKIMQTTSLQTDIGERVPLIKFIPADELFGLQFYFPRYLPNGKPLVSSATKKLWFETVIGSLKIRDKFETGKSRYKGKLEM